MFNVNNDWQPIFDNYDHTRKQKLQQALLQEYNSFTIYPEQKNMLRAFNLTSFNDTKVVILGQDPYPTEGNADGLAFSYNGTNLPKSLRNIFNELQSDLEIVNTNGNLTNWAEQGVLLLNCSLTCRANKPNSHKDLGWHHFTDYLISSLNDKQTPVIFLLWGNNAISKKSLISSHHHILETSHPSPLSVYRGFNGCQHFSKTNTLLKQSSQTPIDWHTY